MNRAMLSGVSGLKTHQTKMDVIGNNIANVNTYGYKAQRAVFSDIYYQSLRSASAGNASRGGINPSSVGYGSMLSGIQSQMTQSSMQNTGFGMDVAITGEGFLQVMDSTGNIFYTKAGMLDYDSNGYLTDINGNFVLGATSADGKPGTQKIRLDSVGSVQPQRPTITQDINGIKYTISASNASKYGNVSFGITAADDLPAGQKASAVISSNGAITVKLNSYESFSSMTDINNAINAAIKEANGGKEHAAGIFTLSADKDIFRVDAVKGSYSGTADATFFGGVKITGVSDNFSAEGQPNFSCAYTPPNMTMTTVVDGKTYTGTVSLAGTDNKTVKLVTANGEAVDGSITMTVPSKVDMLAALGGLPPTTTDGDFATALNATQNKNSYSLSAAQAAQNKPLTGKQIAGDNFGVTPGALQGMDAGAFGGGMTFVKTSTDFTGSGPLSAFNATYNADPDGKNAYWEVKLDIGGKVYTANISEDTAASSILLKSTAGDYIQMNTPSFDAMTEQYKLLNPGATPVAGDSMNALAGNVSDVTAVSAKPSRDVGLSTSNFVLAGGTEGGAITLDKLTSIAIAADGKVSVSHPEKGTVVVGKISLANFANPNGLEQMGTNYYSASANSGEPQLCDPGSDGSGSLKSNSLEMSNVDLSEQFSDMITTQRGFRANSRIITVADTMLEELINLKR